MPAGATYEKIASVTLTIAGANITFESIPSTFTDLRLVIVGKCEVSATNSMAVRVNGDQALNYYMGNYYGNGTTVSASSRSGTDKFVYLNYSTNLPTAASTFALGIVDFYSYAGSQYKTFLAQVSADYNSSGSEVVRTSALWKSTSAITSVTICGDGVNKAYSVGSVFSLYGIAKA
jgi:hypothetical protein